MLLEHECYDHLGIDALVTVCPWSANVVMVWAWMLRSQASTKHPNPGLLGSTEEARKPARDTKAREITRRSERASPATNLRHLDAAMQKFYTYRLQQPRKELTDAN